MKWFHLPQKRLFKICMCFALAILLLCSQAILFAKASAEDGLPQSALSLESSGNPTISDGGAAATISSGEYPDSSPINSAPSIEDTGPDSASSGNIQDDSRSGSTDANGEPGLSVSSSLLLEADPPEQPEIAPQTILIDLQDPTIAHVATQQELKEVLGDVSNRYIDIVTVKLEADIVLTEYIPIKANKKNVIIDGYDVQSPGNRHTITGNVGNFQVLVDFPNATENVTFQNINFKNWKSIYGIVYSVKATKLLFDNVVFNGVQMVYAPQSICTFKNCDINIDDPLAQEVAETAQMNFEGTINILHRPALPAYYAFQNGVAVSSMYVTLKENCVFNIDTSSGFMWNSNISTPFKYFYIHKNAALIVHSTYGLTSGRGWLGDVIEDFRLFEGAKFQMDMTTLYYPAESDDGSLKVKNLQVGPNATFEMVSTAARGALIRFYSDSYTPAFTNANIKLSNQNGPIFLWEKKNQSIELITDRIAMWNSVPAHNDTPDYYLESISGNFCEITLGTPSTAVGVSPNAYMSFDTGNPDYQTNMTSPINMKDIHHITTTYRNIIDASSENILFPVYDNSESIHVKTIPGGSIRIEYRAGGLEGAPLVPLSISGQTEWFAAAGQTELFITPNAPADIFTPYTDIVVHFSGGIYRTLREVVQDKTPPDVTGVVAAPQKVQGFFLPQNFSGWFQGVTDTAQSSRYPTLYYECLSPLETFPLGPINLNFAAKDYAGNQSAPFLVRVMFYDENVAFEQTGQYALYAKNIEMSAGKLMALPDTPGALTLLLLELSQAKAWAWKKEEDFNLTRQVIVSDWGGLSTASTGTANSLTGDPGSPYAVKLAIQNGFAIVLEKEILVTVHADTLSFVSVPQAPAFLYAWYPGETRALHRYKPSWDNFIIYNGRTTQGRTWSLQALLSHEIAAEDNSPFAGHLIYRQDEQADQILNTTTPVKIFDSIMSGGHPLEIITWPEAQGILLQTDFNHIEPDKVYRTSIVWTLIDAP